MTEAAAATGQLVPIPDSSVPSSPQRGAAPGAPAAGSPRAKCPNFPAGPGVTRARPLAGGHREPPVPGDAGQKPEGMRRVSAREAEAAARPNAAPVFIIKGIGRVSFTKFYLLGGGPPLPWISASGKNLG